MGHARQVYEMISRLRLMFQLPLFSSSLRCLYLMSLLFFRRLGLRLCMVCMLCTFPKEFLNCLYIMIIITIIMLLYIWNSIDKTNIFLRKSHMLNDSENTHPCKTDGRTVSITLHRYSPSSMQLPIRSLRACYKGNNNYRKTTHGCFLYESIIMLARLQYKLI